MKNWACDGLDLIVGAADGLACAKDLRRSRCDCSGGPTSRNGGISASEAADDTAQICVTRSGYVAHATSR